jgi:hypothetical protein
MGRSGEGAGEEAAAEPRRACFDQLSLLVTRKQGRETSLCNLVVKKRSDAAALPAQKPPSFKAGDDSAEQHR